MLKEANPLGRGIARRRGVYTRHEKCFAELRKGPDHAELPDMGCIQIVSWEKCGLREMTEQYGERIYLHLNS